MTQEELKESLNKEPVRFFFPPSAKTLESLAKILNLGTTYVGLLNLQDSFKTDVINGIYLDPLYEGKRVKLDKKELGIEEDSIQKEKELEEQLAMKRGGISMDGPSM